MFELKHVPADGDASDGGPRLRCLGGRAGPAGIGADLAALAELPEPVQRRFAEALLPYLGGHPSPEQAAALDAFCSEHAIEPARLVGPIRGARFMLHAAAQAALDEAAFVADVEALAPGAAAVLVPCFRQVMPELRLDIVARAVGEHGRLVDNVSWRFDHIVASDQGDRVDTGLAVLTFSYREGPRQDRVTLGLLPDQLLRLSNACQRLLEIHARSSSAKSSP